MQIAAAADELIEIEVEFNSDEQRYKRKRLNTLTPSGRLPQSWQPRYQQIKENRDAFLVIVLLLFVYLSIYYFLEGSESTKIIIRIQIILIFL